MALSTRRLPSLLRVPASPVPRSRRYYEGATTSRCASQSLIWFASTSHAFLLVRVSLSRSRKVGGPLRAGAFLLPAALSPALARGRKRDLSGLQAIHPVPLLRSRTPVEPAYPRHDGHADAAPAMRTAKASAMADFGANPQLRHPLPYASRVALPHTCKARFRLAGSASTGWESNPLDHYERFQLILSSSSPALLTLPDVASLIRASAAKLAAIPAGASPADIGVQSMS
jgi:hypothetical protein